MKVEINDVYESEHGGYTFAHKITGFKYGTLYSLVSRNRIPHIKLNRRLILFSRNALVKWLSEHEVTPKKNLRKRRGK